MRREKDLDPEDGMLDGEGEEEGVWEGDGVGCDIDVVLGSDEEKE